eukprot:CAMPEP_0194265322 /NCGR_PEP_ID=MMETSP0169-20130528/602_1 /TAXON_ID=218684 /ORGANISM="Corethron pennatum, Strain L29A3" /LENGTH=481 /DNA_ID=CAMNT_0039005761 /DNA_START=156 /DNA_END=1601 /DNA_ORIENTATION=+
MGKGGEAVMAPKKVMGKKTTRYTWDEVKRHSIPEDAWMVYHNKVYDVSNWHGHPGGAVIFTHAGDDMTDIFAAFHARGSEFAMKKFLIGELIPESNESKSEEQFAFEAGYRDLRAQMIKMGLFESSKPFYAYKCASNMALWALAMTLVYVTDNNWLNYAAAWIMGLFFQQCGWLAHDFLHHQVFDARKYGDLTGIYWGNLMQGYSMQWWKNKHNGHHSVPNLHNSSASAQDGDPDIDTMPLLAWSLKQAQSFRELQEDGKDSKFVSFMIKWQVFFYFPILLLARISWMNESFKTAYGLGAASANAALELKRKGLQYPRLEKTGIAIHHLWMAAFSCGFGKFGLAKSLGIYFTATCSCGLLLALVFGLGHNGMATYDAASRPDFWKLQVTTTRNIIGSTFVPQAFVNWFCGGLQLQVEHHLFPMVPRHHLPKVHELVVSFCKEWDVSYHEASLWEGTKEVVNHLAKVSDEFIVEMIEEFPAM